MDRGEPVGRPIESYRGEFPITERYVYLDHAGVAPVSLRVKRAVEGFLTEASREGMFGYEGWMNGVSRIRVSLAKLMGAESDEEVAFIKNTSHGLSIVAEGLDWREGDNLIICEGEFPSNVYPWLNLRRRGVEIRRAPSRGGRISIEDIEGLIDRRTRLLTISSVQFVNGFRIDLKRLGKVCRERGVLFSVDAIQSLGAIRMDVREFQVDFLSADGHKWLLAPEGTGVFYCRRGLAERLNPPLIGWKSVENESDYDRIRFRLKRDALRFEEGSFNVMGIFALGAAVDLLLEVGIERIERRVLHLGGIVIEEAEKRGLEIKTPRDEEERGGIVSIAGNFSPIEIRDRLRAMGIMVNVRGGALRVSPHFYNTEDEILCFFEALDGVLESK